MSLSLTTARKGKQTRNVITVGTSPVMIAGVNQNRKSLVIQNQGSVTVYLGGDDSVSATGASRGYALFAGATFTDDATDQPWFAISGTSGQIVFTIEVQ